MSARKLDRFMEGPKASLPDTGGWKGRHLAGLHARGEDLRGMGLEQGMCAMIRGWAGYADAHYRRFESGIGEDGVLGPQWESIGRSLLWLLNGELGRLDAGTLDGFIRDSLGEEGYSTD